MSQDHDQVEKALAAFTVLLGAVTELARARSGAPALLDAYDDACDQIIDGLRAAPVPEHELQSIHKALARLRLAFEETRN